jgi:ATP-dependent RNA helicase RhlE
MTNFSDFSLAQPIQNSLKEIGYKTPTPIQQQAIPLIMKGHDLLGVAQTGTGKTAAFCLPLIHLLTEKPRRPVPKSPRALILSPTRELAIQIHQSLSDYGKYLDQSYSVIFGGVPQGRQVKEMRSGVDVLVATPGRLLDLIEQKHLTLDKVEYFVLDEADRMLDMGFIRDIKRILPMLPQKKHSLFFSATMPAEIQKLAQSILHAPQRVEVTPPATTVKMIQQRVMYVDKKEKINLLIHLLKTNKKQKTLVFVEMKHIANRVTDKLNASGISAVAIHGNKSQGARQRAIQDFTNDRVQVLVATDIASRGIDIDGISHVINFQLSNVAENYVHRIGRTARAGRSGVAISLVTGEEKSYLSNIEKVTQNRIDVDSDQPYHSAEAAQAAVMSLGKAKALIEGRSTERRYGPTSNSRNSPRRRRPASSKQATRN